MWNQRDHPAGLICLHSISLIGKRTASRPSESPQPLMSIGAELKETTDKCVFGRVLLTEWADERVNRSRGRGSFLSPVSMFSLQH